ncbi:MAG TPA: Rieske 2Fe-2S domain-containing protein [Magnetospirillum sp.]|nr:Rieske 2Fe-2S domain-containing protein [Magnetospirillum sp.]
MPDKVLCQLSDLDATGAKGPIRVAGPDGRTVDVFVVRQDGAVRAWIDCCPHAFVPLEMEPDRFLDLTGGFVLCTMHGAHFDVDTGKCVQGPCRGLGLTAYPIRIHNGKVVADTRPNGV